MAGASLAGVPIAEQLARFVVDLGYEALSRDVIRATKALILDQLACQLIGSTLPWIAPAVSLVELTRGTREESTVVNRGTRLLASDVAFINATFGQACEMDDSASGSAGHIGVATIPVALAMGEREGIDGRKFLTSIVAGYEVMYRLLRSIHPHQHTRGFHSQSIAGPFAAAAVAGKLLGLSHEEMTHALAIAGSHSSGPLEYEQAGGEVKRVHAGIAARGGCHAALLAKFGLTGPATIVEGKRGFCNIFAEKSDPSSIAPGLGDVFNITNTTFKFYPTVGNLHTAIAGTQKLVREHQLKPDDIVGIRVGLDGATLHHGTAIKHPKDVVGAQFSLAFSLALAVTRGRNELQDYMDSALWNDIGMLRLMDCLSVYPHPMATGEKRNLSQITIELRGGRLLETVETYRKGAPQNPPSVEERFAKVRSLSSAVLSSIEIDRLIGTVETIEEIKDVRDLAGLLVSAAGRLH